MDANETASLPAKQSVPAPQRPSGRQRRQAMARRVLVRMLVAPLSAAVLIACGALIVYTGGFGGAGATPSRLVVAIGFVAAYLGSRWAASPRWRPVVRSGLVAVVVLWWTFQFPSNDRDWAPAASRTPMATMDGNRVQISNIRDFRYRSADDFDAAWYDAEFDVSEILGAYFVLTEFGGHDAIAHVMVSFEFEGDRFVVFSAEIRREQGETYDPVGGLFRQYELLYVIADERDAIALRSNVHRDPTWVFPIDAGPEATGRFFVDMAQRATDLAERPQWYNTLTNSFATNLASHYERVNQLRLPPDYRIAMPGYSEELIAELGLLPDGITLEQARAAFTINERAQANGVRENFSRAIRTP